MTLPTDADIRSTRRRRWRYGLTLLLCLGIIAAGAMLATYLKKTAPRAQRRPPEQMLPRVETVTLFPVEQRVSVEGMGSVIPAREMVLKSRVSGQITAVHTEFTAGGIIAQGQRLVTIDPQDYQLALARKKSQLADAEYELRVEMGFQQVARREWELLSQERSSPDGDDELALRKPHLAKARADVDAALAELEQARLDLSRTSIPAPFNALIRDTQVEVGSQVSPQDALAELVGTDEYWIRVALPVERLGWFAIPTRRSDPNDTGAAADVHYRGHQRSGRVIRLLGDLETQGRMARILVAVDDPLGLTRKSTHGPPLLIGEYVRVQIQGRLLTGVYRIPRSSLRDGNTIWLAAPDDTLQVKPVEIVWRDDRVVLVRDHLQAGDRLIVSDVVTPVPGMPLDVSTARSESNQGENGDG